MRCNQCGAEFEGKFCPECGTQAGIASPLVPPVTQAQQGNVYQATPSNGKPQKKKKPFFLRWWFILLVIIACIVGIGKLGGGNKIVWEDMALSSVIPEPPSKNGKVYTNSDKELNISLKKVSDSQYNSYVKECTDEGFTVDVDKENGSYKAYNESGYYLDMYHYSDKLSITLKAPMSFGTIQWPSSTAGRLLPAPNSTTGKFSFEYDDSFFVYISETSKDDYAAYVNACMDSGFKVDYNKGDTFYYADNEEGWHISLRYEGNSIMTIKIDGPDEEEPETEENILTTAKPDPEIPVTEAPKPVETTKPSGNSGLGKEFKAAMDSYEKFMDEYVAFMKRYMENPSDLSLLLDYTNYMSEYAECMEAFEKWESEDLNADELAYYIEVQSRVSKKLLEVAQ